VVIAQGQQCAIDCKLQLSVYCVLQVSDMRLPTGKEADGVTFAATGVPFNLSAVPALEAADGIEELSLSEAVLHQVWWT